MLWADKFKEWKHDDVTQAFRQNVFSAITEVREKLVYAEEFAECCRLQGLARAYMDMLELLNSGEFEPSSECEEDLEEDSSAVKAVKES